MLKKILLLRKNLREAGVEYKVYKNTLVTLAAKELGLDGIVELFRRTCINSIWI